MNRLRKTFEEQLKDLHDAEQQLLKALPKVAKASEQDEMKAAFAAHREETEEPVTRLQKVFKKSNRC